MAGTARTDMGIILGRRMIDMRPTVDKSSSIRRSAEISKTRTCIVPEPEANSVTHNRQVACDRSRCEAGICVGLRFHERTSS